MLVCAVLGCGSSQARAESGRTPPVEHDAPLPPGDAKRPLPDYGGPEAPRRRESAALWLPRVALFPLFVLSEYGIRRPVGAVYTWAERHHFKQRYHEFFTFDEAQKIGLFPTGNLDLGLRPHAGAYFFWLDAVGKSDVKLRLTTGGVDLWTLNSLLSTPLDRRSQLRLTFDYALRPDSLFYGLGRAVREEATHYRSERYEGRATLAWHEDRLWLSTNCAFISTHFDAKQGHDSLGEAIAQGRLAPPPALADGELALASGVGARWDTRPPRLASVRSVKDLEPRSGTGYAIAVHATHFTGLSATRARPSDTPRTPQWLRYGGTLSGALDLTGTHRTLELETMVELVEPLPGDDPVPFNEQVGLGGSYPLRAFTPGRLIDESAAVTTLSYNWPILPDIDGSIHYSLGNVFARHLRDFDPAHLRSSFGIGMASIGSPDHPFELLLALGTEPFDRGGSIETLRLVFGTRAGF